MSAYVTTGSDSLWIKSQKNISASGNVIVDTIKLTSFRSIKYIVTVYNKGLDKGKTLEMNLLKENAGIKETIYGKIGVGVNIAMSTGINGGNLEITVQNNELFPVTCEFAKLILGS
jgi:hypothetical protein